MVYTKFLFLLLRRAFIMIYGQVKTKLRLIIHTYRSIQLLCKKDSLLGINDRLLFTNQGISYSQDNHVNINFVHNPMYSTF